MALTNNLKNLNIILQAMNEDHLSRDEFTAAIKQIIDVVNDTRNELNSNSARQVEDASQRIDATLRTVEGKMNELTTMNNETRTLSESDRRTIVRMMEQKFNDLVIPDEFNDGEVRELIEEVRGLIPELPDIPKEFDATELLETIEELKEEVEELKRRPTGTIGGGVTDMRIRQAFKTILNTEKPSGLLNGSNTTYTVLNTIFSVVEFSLNGEVIPELPNYTKSGNTITFNTALPSAYAGKDFEIRYIG